MSISKRFALLAVAVIVLGGALGAWVGMWLVPQPAHAQISAGERSAYYVFPASRTQFMNQIERSLL